MYNYKIEIIKLDKWYATLFYNNTIKWYQVERVESNSYLELQKEIGNKGFFEKVNQNK